MSAIARFDHQIRRHPRFRLRINRDGLIRRDQAEVARVPCGTGSPAACSLVHPIVGYGPESVPLNWPFPHARRKVWPRHRVARATPAREPASFRTNASNLAVRGRPTAVRRSPTRGPGSNDSSPRPKARRFSTFSFLSPPPAPPNSPPPK